MRTPLEKVIESAAEFIQDWRKGDFDLPELAACDARSLEAALVEYFETQHEKPKA